MFTHNLVLSGLMAVASATNGKVQDANYDDISLPPAVDIHPVNTYKGLTYNSFAAIDTGLGGEVLTGIELTSRPHCITTQVVSDILHGTPYIVSENGKPWTPKGINFGCALATVESAVGVPISCNLVVKGYDKNDVEVAEQSFPFAPTGFLKSDMVKAEFNGKFKGISKLTFENKSQTGVLTAYLYDDFKYTLQ